VLDIFLKAAYQNQDREQQIVKLANDMKKLPVSTLLKVAAGTSKLAYGSDPDWLDKYKGTALFEEAMSLERACLESEVAEEAARAQRPDMSQFDGTRDQLRLQKKMLDLKLVELQEQNGLGMKPGGELQTEGAAQGAGALGDVPSEGVQDSIGGTVGSKTGSAEKKAWLLENEVTKSEKFRKAHEAMKGKRPHERGSAFTEEYNKKAALDFKALGQGALAAVKSNPALAARVAGGVGGAALGAAAGGPEHRLSGALTGGALGAGAGHLGATAHATGLPMGEALQTAAAGMRDQLKAHASNAMSRLTSKENPAALEEAQKILHSSPAAAATQVSGVRAIPAMPPIPQLKQKAAEARFKIALAQLGA
jgi:hypothetical protein